MNLATPHKQQAFLLSTLCFLPIFFGFLQSTHWFKVEPISENNLTLSIAQFVTQSMTQPTPPTPAPPIPQPVQKKIEKPLDKPIKKQKRKKEMAHKPTPAPQEAIQSPAPVASVPTSAQPAPAQSEQFLSYASSGSNNPFLRAVKLAIDNAITYPRQARKMHIQGEVLVEFLWTKNKLLKDITIRKSSGHNILDKSAVKTIEKASLHFPSYKSDARLQIPIVYRLEN